MKIVHDFTFFLKGNAVKKLIKEKGYKREEIFITTKVNSHEYTYDKTMAAMKKSFEKLGLDYVDLVSLSVTVSSGAEAGGQAPPKL